MAKASSINFVLKTGTPDGIIEAKMSNWTGIAFRFPRNEISLMKDFPILDGNPLVYILVGEKDAKTAYYIGETDDPINRMKQHLKEDFWNEALLYAGLKEIPLNKAEIKYLEHNLYLDALKVSEETKRSILVNGNTPKESPLSEEGKIRADDFEDNLKLLTSLFGYKIFQSYIQEPKTEEDPDKLFYIKRSGADARAIRTDEGLVVLKGSKTAHGYMEWTNASIQNRANKLREDGVIKDDVFMVDYLFKTPSAASAMVLGRNTNGTLEWKTKAGKSLKEIELN
jgi:hypothetical protein